MFFRLAALALSFIVATGCATTIGSGPPIGVEWVPPGDDPDVLLEPAKELAKDMLRGDRCRAEFEALPGWPIGKLTTRTVEGWPGASKTQVARTLWRDENKEKGLYRIDPIVEILAAFVIHRSTSMVAITLIHETVHAASAPHLEDDKRTGNEELAERIAGLCARAHGFMYVPPGVAQN